MRFALILVFFTFLVQPPAPQDPFDEVVALQNRALRGNEANRIADQRRSIDIAQRLGRPRLLAVLLERLGRSLELRNVQDAVIDYEAALSALSGDTSLKVREELNRIAAMEKGLPPGSKDRVPADLYSKALDEELTSAEANPALVAQILIDIGNAYFSQPQLPLALDRYQAALARPEIATEPKLRAYALANSGEILRRQGATAQAEQNFRQALDLLRQYSEPADSRRALVMLARIDRDRGRDGEALEGFMRALSLYAQTEDTRGEGRAYAALGQLHLKARRFTDAGTAYKRAIELGEKADDTLSLWYTYWGMAQVQRNAGDLADAVKSLEKSLVLIESGQQNLTTDEGKVALLDSAQDVFDELISLHLDSATNNNGSKQALSVAERARAGAMRELMGPGGRRQLFCPSASPPQADPPMSLTAQMAPAVISGAAQRGPGLPSGQAARGPSPQARDLSLDPRCADGRSTRNVNPVGLHRLVFHVLDDSTAVFAVSPSGDVRAHVAQIGRDALAHRVAEFRDALEVDTGGPGLEIRNTSRTQPPNAYRALARALYRDLIAPVAGAIPDNSELVIEPHGPLWLVPFAALENDAGQALIEQWAILYSPSEEILGQIRQEPPFEFPKDLKALIIGNPTTRNLDVSLDDTFRSGTTRATFKPLPGAENEAKAIAKILSKSPQKLLVRGDATLRAIESETPAYTIIHLASHALANSSHPLDSFIMLAGSSENDGLLTTRRILNLTINADLVTLSACQTGMGYLSGDGVIGLSRAFLVRGARSVVVSQWNVSDTATSALMEVFYKHYINEGTDKARALQEAMKNIKGRRDFSHPKFWASFVLIGSER